MTTDFPKFATIVAHRFDQLSKNELYVVNVARDELFELYLASFPSGTNPIFRVRSEHDGSYDRNFIRNVGHVVALIDGKIETLWDIPNLPHPYDVVAKALDEHVRAAAIRSLFRVRERQFGNRPNIETIDGQLHTFTHFHVQVRPAHFSTTPEADRGTASTNLGVFRRGLEELTSDALDTVLDLIKSNNLYRGAEFKTSVEAFKLLHNEYPRGGSQTQKDLYLWTNVGNRSSLFRNSAIGTLVVDLSAGDDLEKSVRSFEAKVAPLNYKRPTALITPKMIEQAVETLNGLGLDKAVERRFAKLSDVSVNNVLFVNNDARTKMKDGLTGLLMSAVAPATVDVKGAEEISIEDFIKHKLHLASEINLLVENKHLGNFVSLTAPVHEDTGRLFKWNNDFAWSYDGDVADSIKERVKKAGGNIDAPLRVSLAWHNADDLDLHAQCPDGIVYYHQKLGILDVDMNGMDRHDEKNPVENLSWQRPRDGNYAISVHQYSQRRNSDVGFEVEFYFNGETHSFSHPQRVAQSERIELATFKVKNGVVVDFKAGSKLTKTSGSLDKWGVSTQTLVPISTLLASPNHWNDQQIGNKHWFFILKDCVNPGEVRGIYNEFLRSDLEAHRKVFEVLGSKTKAKSTPEQLSGVGFSSTRKDEVIVVVNGATINKAYRIKF